jgi:DNA-binding transcriptional MocR family regulator
MTVPEGVDTKAMLPRAVTARVAYVSGTGFYANGFGSRQLRLSFCYPTPERIREGVRRLATVLAEELDLFDTFGPATRQTGSGPQVPAPDTA